LDRLCEALRSRHYGPRRGFPDGLFLLGEGDQADKEFAVQLTTRDQRNRSCSYQVLITTKTLKCEKRVNNW